AWERQSAHLPFSRAHLARISCHFHLVMVEPLVIVIDFLSGETVEVLGAAAGCDSVAGGVVSAGGCAVVWPKAMPQPSNTLANAAMPLGSRMPDMGAVSSVKPFFEAASGVEVPGDARVIDLRGVESAQIFAGADGGLGVHPFHLADAADADLRVGACPFERIGAVLGGIIVEPAFGETADRLTFSGRHGPPSAHDEILVGRRDIVLDGNARAASGAVAHLELEIVGPLRLGLAGRQCDRRGRRRGRRRGGLRTGLRDGRPRLAVAGFVAVAEKVLAIVFADLAGT